MSKKKGKSAIVLIILAVAVIAGCFIAYEKLNGFDIQEAAYIYIDSDDDADSVRQKIVDNGKPKCISMFDALKMPLKFDSTFRTGKYEINNGMSILNLMRNIRNHNQVPVNLVVPSGLRTNEDIASRLTKNIMLDSATVASFLNDEGMLQKYDLDFESVNGFFIPNTYEVWWDMPLDALMDRMAKEKKAFWTSERIAKLDNLKDYSEIAWTEADVMNLASIVESETANNAEKPAIAGLYINRMKIGMPLQSDPTIKFALKDFALRRILNEHLKVNSPYNTYINPGLPPGPICIPSIASIDAVLNFQKHGYLYMCAKEDFSGTHNFAVTYGEHLKNAAKYTMALNARKIFK